MRLGWTTICWNLSLVNALRSAATQVEARLDSVLFESTTFPGVVDLLPTRRGSVVVCFDSWRLALVLELF